MSSHCLEVETNQVPAPGSSSTLTISSSKSRHPPWTELLYEVLKHLKALSKDITRNERMCDGCENLMLYVPFEPRGDKREGKAKGRKRGGEGEGEGEGERQADRQAEESECM